jgi:hypothetical protein
MTGRNERRLALDEPTRLAPNDWSSLEIRMLECTATDFRAVAPAAVPVGQPVMLEVPGIGWVRAYVSWQRSGQFTAIFAEPIELARAGFMSVNREAVLARLLTERATAHAAGNDEEERDLRTRICEQLPVRRVAGGSAKGAAAGRRSPRGF